MFSLCLHTSATVSIQHINANSTNSRTVIGAISHASEMTYIVSSGALNSTHSTQLSRPDSDKIEVIN